MEKMAQGKDDGSGNDDDMFSVAGSEIKMNTRKAADYKKKYDM